MKNLKLLLVVFAVLIACSQIGLSQTIKDTLIKKIYLVDVKGNVMKVESESKLINLCCSLENNTILRKGFEPKEQSRIFNLWYLFAVLGIVFMILVQITKNNDSILELVFMILFLVVTLFAVMAVFVFLFVFLFAGAFAFLFAFLFALLFALVFIFAAVKNKKIANVFAWLYYVCMIAAGIFAYLQW